MSFVATALVTNSFKVKDTELVKEVFEKLSFEMYIGNKGQLTGYAKEDLLDNKIHIAVTESGVEVFSDCFDNCEKIGNYPQTITWEQFIQEQLLDEEFLVIKTTETESKKNCVLDVYGSVLVITKNKRFRTNLDLQVDNFLKLTNGRI